MAIEFCCKSLWDRTLTSRTSAQGGEHSAATVMAADDDVLDMKSRDRILQHGMNVGVERRREIGDVTVHEELARREADDLVGRYPAIGAADPEIFWPLDLAQTFEIFRIPALDFGGPLAIVVKQVDRNFIRSPVRNSPRRPTNRRSTSKQAARLE